MVFLIDHLEERRIKKGTVLFEQGAVVSTIFFVSTGILHHFNYTEKGEKKTIDLHDAPCFCTDLESFTEGKLSKDSCVALTDATIYVLTKEKYDALVNTNVKWSNFVKRVIEKTLVNILEQLKTIANKTIEERYLDLVKTKPDIVQNTSVGTLASYLGTSRETLHRIRKKHLFA